MFRAQWAAATMLHGLAAMLYEAQEYNEALVWAKEALKLREAQQKGKRTGMAVAEHLVQVAECMSKAGTSSPNSQATAEASAGMQVSGAQLPATTMPMSDRLRPARSMASFAALAPH